MPFLTELHPPSPLTLARIVRTRRKAIIDETRNTITLYKETTRLEITLPSVIGGLQDKLARVKTILAQAFAPPFRSWCYVA